MLVWLIPLTLMGTHARFALIACGRQRKEFLANSLGLAALLVVSVPAVGSWGAVGASAAMLLSSAVAWFSAHWLVRPHVPNLPFVGPLLRPLAASVTGMLLASLLRGSNGWIPVAAGLGSFMLMGLAVEPALRADLMALLRSTSKSSEGGET